MEKGGTFMNISSFGIAGVAAITVICFLVCELVKATPLDKKWLPVISGGCGGLLGIAALYVMPDYPAPDIITAVAVGIVSGLAATGINQVYKQLSGGQGR
jgi:O-antigen/teichoic acid export membrane protein